MQINRHSGNLNGHQISDYKRYNFPSITKRYLGPPDFPTPVGVGDASLMTKVDYLDD